MEHIIELIEDEGNPMLGEGFNKAIVGMDYKNKRSVYSIELIIEVLMKEHNLSHGDAIDEFDFNIGGATYDNCPMFIWTR